MPRYFFHVIDGSSARDDVGLILPDLDAAKAAAVVFSGELIREMGKKFWDISSWQLDVVDERGTALFALRFSGWPY